MAKPELLKSKVMTQADKDRLNKMAKMLAADWMTKPQIIAMFKVSERQARDYVSMIAKRVPVISLSSGKGYKRAMTSDDLDLAKASMRELISRQKELNDRLIMLEKFIKEKEKEVQNGHS